MIARSPPKRQLRRNSQSEQDAGPIFEPKRGVTLCTHFARKLPVTEQGAVPMIVMTKSQDHVEAINSTLRKAGHPVHCTWLPDARDLSDALTQINPEMLIAFIDELGIDLASIMKVKQQSAPGMPVLIVRDSIDETIIAEAMRLGCQDVVTLANRSRLQAVVSRELRAFRL